MFELTNIIQTRRAYSLGSGVVKLARNLNYVQNQEDTLEQFLKQTINLCEQKVGKTFFTSDVEALYNIKQNWSLKLVLPADFISSVTSVTVYDIDNVGHEVPSSDYSFYNKIIPEILFSSLPVLSYRTSNGVKVSYVAGLGTKFDDFPESVQDRLIAVASYYFSYRLELNELPKIIARVFGDYNGC